MTALVMGPVWSHFQNLHNNHTTDQLNTLIQNVSNSKPNLFVTDLGKSEILIRLPIFFYILFGIWFLEFEAWGLEFGTWLLEFEIMYNN